MGVTTWYFVAGDAGRMERVPVARMDRFFDGEEALPHANRAVLATEVTLTGRNRRIVQVHRLLWIRFAVDGEGRCDDEALDVR